MTTSLQNKTFPLTEPTHLEDFLVEVGIVGDLKAARKLIGNGSVMLTFEKTTPKVTVIVRNQNYLIRPSMMEVTTK